MWLVLVIVGAVLLIIGYAVPMPAPVNMICRIIGAVCLIVGLVLFIFAALAAHPISVGMQALLAI